MQSSAIDAAWSGSERCQHCAVRDSALFAGLEKADFQRIHLPIDELRFRRGEPLYHAGTDINHVMTIRSGLVKLVQHRSNGDQRIVRLLRQGSLAGIERLSGSPVENDAVALNDVLVCRIPIAVVDALQTETPRLYEQLMQQWQRIMSEASTWLSDLSTGTARSRVARLLLLLDENKEGPQMFLPSREEMGAILGITTESTSKVTAEFRRQGWLNPVDGHFATLQREAIESLVAG